MRRHGCRSDDRGETLLEVLIALAILGVAVAGVFTGVVVSIRGADTHRKATDAGVLVRSYAEAVEAAVASGGYTPTCAPTYASTFPVPAGYTKAITAVSFWDGSGFPAACNAAADVGLQQLTLEVSSNDGRGREQLVVVVRQPCGAGSTCT
jgi:prepilin-type N-terminal cleavage/methylation domain-containing protein